VPTPSGDRCGGNGRFIIKNDDDKDDDEYLLWCTSVRVERAEILRCTGLDQVHPNLGTSKTTGPV
jgi:hypothetical protein